MKHTFLAIIIILFYLQPTITVAMKAPEYGIAIPVAYNTQTNEWSVLLGLHQDKTWWPFSAERQPGENASKAAERALAAGTNDMYTITIQGVPWQKIGDIYYHIVPVPFIRGNELYTKGRSKAITDFVWIPANKLLVKGPVQPKVNEKYVVGEAFLKIFNTLWPQKVAELKKTMAQAPQPTKPTGPGPWTQYATQADSWGNIPGAIYFYSSNKPYYEFTNFYERDITIDGKTWPTSEQYYQAMKFTDSNLQETIRRFKSDSSGSAPRKAFQFAQQNKQSVRSDWQKISLDAMRKAVRAKFSQHKDLRDLLLSTDNKILVEDAGANDAFYGAGADYKGQNWLGRILMAVRDELRTQPMQPIAPQVGSQIVPPSMPAKQLIQSLQILEQSLNALANTFGKPTTFIGLSAQPVAPAIARELFDPFVHVTGMTENQFVKLSEAQKQALTKGNAFVNQKTKQPWNMGTVDIASVEQLRKIKKAGSGSTFNVLEGVDTPWDNWFRAYLDVTALQAAPENKDAVFQVASNFNGLEGNGDPSSGIMSYLSPGLYVQGEASAISAMPGIIYRMYYMPHIANGMQYHGQLQQQLNLLEAFNTPPYVLPVHNGYIGKVNSIDAFAELSDAELKTMAGKVNIAFHKNIQVSGGLGPQMDELPNYVAQKINDPSQRINQIFAAAMNPYQYNPKSAGFKNLAQMLLYAAYEGGLKSAYAHGKKKVYLTLIGGGVFQNDLSWITKAIRHAVLPFLTFGDMEINLIVYYSGSYKKQNMLAWNEFEATMKDLVQKSSGQYVQFHTSGKEII